MERNSGIISSLAAVPADFRIAFRRLLRRPAFTASAVLIFGLGTGFTTALAGVYRSLFLRPLGFGDEARVMAIRSTFPDDKGHPQESVASGFEFLSWKNARSFAAIGAHTPRDVSVLRGDQVERLRGEAVTASLFATLGVPPLLGRLPTEDDERQGADVAVLSYEFWARRMGADSGLVGRPLRIDGRPHVVIGILKPGFTTLFQTSDLYLPLVITQAAYPPSQRRTLGVVGRLAAEAAASQEG